MYQESYHRGDAANAFQAHARMRVPHEMLPHLYQVYVINAIRDNKRIDHENLYERALADVVHGENGVVFAELSNFLERLSTGKLRGIEIGSALLTLASLHRVDQNDDAYPNVKLFDHRFLNDRGGNALVTVLIFDAAEIDAVTIDRFRGGDNLKAAYGPRKTRQDKELGTLLQRFLKQFASVDEPAIRAAAEHYVEYRYHHHGKFQDYLRQTELSGNAPSESYLRKWFRRFDKAFKFPRARRGRPRGPAARRQ